MFSIYNLKKIIFLIVGFFIFLFFLCLKGQYRGPQIFYRASQKADSFFGQIAREFIKNKTLGQLFTNYSIYSSEYNNPRCSKIAIMQYSTADLSGYGAKDFKMGGENLLEQQRALIIPFMNDFLNNKKKLNVCDIGCGNGDVAVYMADKYRDKNFYGIDFNVENAKQKHPSIDFFDGYALDIIEKFLPDAIYSSSTWILFTPRENFFELKEAKNLEMITRIFFSQRRKMLKKPFNQLFNNSKEVSEKFKINLNLRPQNLEPEMYYKLVKEYESLRR